MAENSDFTSQALAWWGWRALSGTCWLRFLLCGLVLVLGAAFPGGEALRVPGTLDGFELAVRAILGQQVTVAAGRTFTQRLADRFGSPLATPHAGLNRLFPTPAVLANCSMPEAMSAALAALKPLGLPFGAYANGFSEISNLPLPDAVAAPEYTHRHDLTPEKYTAFVMEWVELGATIVGGCCEVGPAHIRHLATTLRAAGHTIA